MKTIGKGTWIDKLTNDIIERELKLSRNINKINVESGLGASGIPHIGSLGDAVRAYGVKMALEDNKILVIYGHAISDKPSPEGFKTASKRLDMIFKFINKHNMTFYTLSELPEL